MVPLVLYHAGCADGFCAAWLFHHAFPDAEYVPVSYGQDPPDVTGREVYILDFSYKRPVLEEMIRKASSLVVLDHHKTAEAELAGLPGCTFDLGKSGGRLAWEYLVGRGLLTGSIAASVPWLVEYTEDRDLWRWSLPNSKEINAALRTYRHSFSLWNLIAFSDGKLLVFEGVAILRAQDQCVQAHVSNAREITLAGHRVLCVNATVHQSEIGEELAKNRPFSVTYRDRKDGLREYSLRSRDGGLDVSVIAKQFGGGGHPQAAGFELPIGVDPEAFWMQRVSNAELAS